MIIKSKKWLRVISVFGIGIVLIILFSIGPSYYDAAGDIIKWYELNNSKDSVKVFDLKLKAMQDETHLLKVKMNSMLNKAGEDNKSSTFIEDLNLTAKSSGLELISIKTSSIEKEEKLLIQPVELILEGNYFQLHSFARQIEESARTFIIQNISVQKAGIKNDMLSMVINMDVYINL